MKNDAYLDSKIMIVDDKNSNILYLEGILEDADYTNYSCISDSRKALNTFLSFKPDIVLLDLHMPHMDGFEVMKQLKEHIPSDTFLPILVLTADITFEAKQRAFEGGAADFLTKPFDPIEASLRIQNLLKTRLMHGQIQNQNRILDQKVIQRTLELEESRTEILERLARAAEYRDDDTGEHTKRVGNLVAKVAMALGLSDKVVKELRLASPLHDIGKIGIPDSILLNPGKLTPEEWEVMKSHTKIGAKILSGSQSPLLKVAEEIALTHHECWDGRGYMGLEGDDIPISGRIVTIVDVFDALTHERPYKKAWTIEEALNEIEIQSGKKFDPLIVKVFLEIVNKG